MQVIRAFVVTVLVNLITLDYSALGISCVDENNNEVDWYVLYKMPHIKKGPNRIVKKGVGYLYITSNNVTDWTLSELSINYTMSFLSNTLDPLYSNKQLLHLLYNDEPPNEKAKSTKGHTKGIIIGDNKGGIWIVHSVPLFPPPSTEKYAYPNTGAVYGQSVLCITMNVTNLDKIGIQLQYNTPKIYSYNLPQELSLQYSLLSALIDGKAIPNAPWFHTLDFESINGTAFKSFAKAKQFNKDLYEDWVAPELGANLMVETWLNGPGRLASNCSKPYSVINVEEITLKQAQITFKSANDHSKWAVSKSTDNNWICIGDINRAEHQKHRGGGTVCFNNSKIAEAYRNTINAIENCSKP